MTGMNETKNNHVKNFSVSGRAFLPEALSLTLINSPLNTIIMTPQLQKPLHKDAV